MELDRRGFLGLAVGAFTGAPARGASAAPEGGISALEIHHATRNTLTSALTRLWPSGPAPRRSKPHPGLPRVALPRADRDGRPLAGVVRGFAPAPAVEAAPLGRETLAHLLHLANGVTRTRKGSFPLRAAPSAGALYAGELYVAVREVTGLEPGLYAFHVPRGELVRLAAGDPAPAVAEAVERPAAISDAPAIVLLTNVFFRYAHRYGDRGYRYALIDTGHIGENLRLAAAEAGLDVASVARFHDDRLNARLGIDGRTEAVCALHAIGRRAEAAAEPRTRRLVQVGTAPPGLRPSEAYHAGSRLVPADGPTTSSPAPPGPVGTRADAQQAQSLPEREDPPATVSSTIEERRSAARFVEAPIAPADLGFVLDAARGNPRSALVPGIGLRVVAHRVREWPPGLYRYAPRAGLVRLLERDLRRAMRSACLGQQKAETAAVGIAMVADLRRAASDGDRSYRDLLIEAGAVAERLYLAAEAVGLAARNLAAFYDDDLNALLGLDGRSEAVVHLTMVGAGD